MHLVPAVMDFAPLAKPVWPATIVMIGTVTSDDLQQLLESLSEDELRLSVTPNRITDLLGASFSDLSSDKLVVAAEIRRDAKLKNKVKSAFIATRPEQYGLARIFMGYNQNPDVSIMIFKDSVSAYNWIGAGSKSDDGPDA